MTRGRHASRFAPEVRTAVRWINAILAAPSSPTDERDGAARTLDRYLEVVARVKRSAGRSENTGLLSLCALLGDNLVAWRDECRGLTAGEHGLLEQWPELLTRYLQAPDDDEVCSRLVRYLSDRQWKMPLSVIEADDLARMLKAKEESRAVVHCDEERVGVPSSRVLEEEQENCWHSDAASARQATGEAEHIAEEVTVLSDDIQPDACGSQADVRITPPSLRGQEAEEIADEIIETVMIAGPGSVQGEEPAGVSADCGIMVPVSPADEALSRSAVEPADDGAGVEARNDPSATALNDEPRGAQPLSSADDEMVQLLRDELATSADAMTQMLATMTAPDAEPAARAQALVDYREQIERLMLASEAMGLDGFRQVFAQMQANVPAVDGDPCEVSVEMGRLLEASVPFALEYLGAVGDMAASIALVEHFQAAGWPQRLSADDALVLADLLSNPALTTAGDESAPRPVKASAEDASLALPEDLNPELLDGLLQELPVQTGAFTAAMQRIAAGTGVPKDLEDAKRAAHTLKGAANTVGVRGIANLTHHLEDILIAMSKHGTIPNRALAGTLLNAGDCLEAMSETLLGVGEEPADALQVFQEVLDWANRIDRDGVPAPDETAAAGPEAVVEIQSEHEQTGGELAQAATPMLRVPARVVDEMLRLTGEMIISNGQLQERLRESRKQGKALAKQQGLFQQLTNELENVVDIRGSAARLHRSDNKDEFDPLEFEHYSELHTITRRLIEAASDGREMSAEWEQSFTRLNDVLEAQRRLQIQSQDGVMQARMMKVKSVFSRLQRGVRQTCRLLDKQVELKLFGADTYVDSNVLNDLVDPLMHVLRNAIDHGIEPAAVRRERGKNPVGHIDLSFGREANYLVVRCKDDGAGLNLDVIRVVAEEKGLISPDGMLTSDEIGRLILVPGFSTRAEATQVSGRGIGMDVVQSRILEMKGSLNLHTETDCGLTVELRVPATLISTHGLLVRVRDKLLAVSSRGIEDIHYVTPEQIKLLGNGFTYHVAGQVYEVVSFEVLLDLPEDRRYMNRAGFPALLVRLDSGALRVVLVQEVVDSCDLVVKSLGRYVPKAKGVIGATVLGDGGVAPVIDMPELLRNPERSERRATDTGITSAQTPGSLSRAAKRTALVVDDSLTARRVAAEVMRNAGYEVRTAMDGMEAVSVIEKKVPDIILVDMEMPRMNGLEFTAHVRAREATRQVPVIMITSRSTDKHRQQASAAGVNVYLTKPFNGDHLLEQVASLCG